MPDAVAYAELHCHSHYSFLDGASSPSDLVAEASRLGLTALAITEHDGLHGAVQFAHAARQTGLATVFGSELNLDLAAPRTGAPDPGGEHLLVLATGVAGYRWISRVVTSAYLRTDRKAQPVYDRAELAGAPRGDVMVLTGCRRGAVRTALAEHGVDAADHALAELVEWFGAEHVLVELIDHGLPLDDEHNEALVALAERRKLRVVATNNVHYAVPRAGRLAQTMAAVRARRGLAEMAGWLPPSPAAHLRSAQEQAWRFRRWPHAVTAAAEIAQRCAFDLALIRPRLPPYPVPLGHTEDSWLRARTLGGAAHRYGPREAAPAAYAQLEHELRVIAQLGFAGYFLIVGNIVEFCKVEGILCQGRGSAANSATCYALGITNCDPVRWGLLFERFLSVERGATDPPDIDLDIEADRRELVIQYVYGTYGRRHAALVATVISYRQRLALRDVGRALGYDPGQADSWIQQLGRGPLPTPDQAAAQGIDVPDLVLELAGELQTAPRHLGIHPGGMVLTDRPVSEVVPVEQATMRDRTVLQWDKDDCARAGLVKFDLLGLGMLSAIRHTLDQLTDHTGTAPDIAHLDLADPAVYDMLCAADTVGVFQVESRAQMSTLPRLRPRNFADLAVQVALIRPGPIQGGAVNPYIQRRNGKPWRHPHPLLARALDKTLGVILYQEQIMQVAMDMAGMTGGEADMLRRAMGSKRSTSAMQQLRARFLSGAAERGVPPAVAEDTYDKIAAFAGYGFPESHALSFAHIVYVSAFLKRYHPAAFLSGLLRAQPMGFYSPQSLVADARRHGVVVRGVDLHHSAAESTLEACPDSPGGWAVRLGLGQVRDIGAELAAAITADRDAHGPYRDQAALARRAGLNRRQLESLATAGAFTTFSPRGGRRAAIWDAGAASRDNRGVLPHTTLTAPAPVLPGMSTLELVAADLWATRISPDLHPMELLRDYFTRRDAITVAAIAGVADGTRITIGGTVTHRQAPPTARGMVFLSVEDETGICNVICSPGLDRRYAAAVRRSPVVLVRGRVQWGDGAVNLVADLVTPVDDVPAAVLPSRDWS